MVGAAGRGEPGVVVEGELARKRAPTFVLIVSCLPSLAGRSRGQRHVKWRSLISAHPLTGE